MHIFPIIFFLEMLIGAELMKQSEQHVQRLYDTAIPTISMHGYVCQITGNWGIIFQT